ATGHLSEPTKLWWSAATAASVIAPRHAAVSFRACCGPSPASSTQPSASPTLRLNWTRSFRFWRLKSLVEQGTKTGQLFRGSKFAGVASTATAYGGTTLPPCAANDFSCALRGTLASTVEPGAKLVPAKLSEGAADSALNSEKKFSATISLPTKSNLFDIAVAAATWLLLPRRNNLCLSFEFKRKFATREKLSESPPRHRTSPSDWRIRETPAHGGETVR